MERQLTLLPDDKTDWRLDEKTRETGRTGLAAARQALADAQRRAAA
jgi:hypothetical protein